MVNHVIASTQFRWGSHHALEPQILSVQRAPTLVLILLACGLLLLAAPAPPVKPVRRVLIIYDVGSSYPAIGLIDKGIRAALENLPYQIEIYTETLEVVLFPDEGSQQKFRNWYIKKYQDRKPDLIIAAGAFAIRFMTASRKRFFSGTPVVFLGDSEGLAGNPTFDNQFAGAWMVPEPEKTLDAAMKLQPGTKHIVVVGGVGEIDRENEAMTKKRLHNYEASLDFTYLTDLEMPSLLERLKRLPRNTIILYTNITEDSAGTNFVPATQSLPIVAAAANAPVFSMYDSLFGHGTVGGYLESYSTQGRVAGEMAVRILKGEKPENIPIVRGTSVYMFDWRQLQRWGFSEHDLPPGSVVEFRTPTAWEQYRWRIIAIGVVIITQALLIVGLLIQRYRRRRAEESLRDMTGRLLQSQDDERRRIARDLHDGTGQHLSGIALSVGQVLADFPRGHDRLRQLLQDSHVASRQALDEIRAVSFALHPPILDGLGLIPALQWYLDGLQKRAHFGIDFEAPANLADISPDGDRTLFRIVQESVTNVLRHSGATAMKIKMSNGEKGLTLEIQDNGHGMSTEDLDRAEGALSLGVGVAGMRERVRQLGGTFKIVSTPTGTKVLVSLPTREAQYATHTTG